VFTESCSVFLYLSGTGPDFDIQVKGEVGASCSPFLNACKFRLVVVPGELHRVPTVSFLVVDSQWLKYVLVNFAILL